MLDCGCWWFTSLDMLHQVIRWGAVLAVTSAAYQFLTNLHTVPITGRTQVVVLTNEEECVRTMSAASGPVDTLANGLTRMPLDLQELGTKAATDDIQKAKLVKSGPRYRMCVDIAAYVTLVSMTIYLPLQPCQ